VNKELATGSYSAEWNSTNVSGQAVASGVYFYRLIADGFSKSRKMLLLKRSVALPPSVAVRARRTATDCRRAGRNLPSPEPGVEFCAITEAVLRGFYRKNRRHKSAGIDVIGADVPPQFQNNLSHISDLLRVDR
jgi:hypothetical protein